MKEQEPNEEEEPKEEATPAPTQDVQEIGNGTYLVSATDQPGKNYKVRFDNFDRPAYCGCLEWARRKVPCEHIDAVQSVLEWSLENGFSKTHRQDVTSRLQPASDTEIVVELQTYDLPADAEAADDVTKAIEDGDASSCPSTNQRSPAPAEIPSPSSPKRDEVPDAIKEEMDGVVRDGLAMLQKVCVMQANDIIQDVSRRKDLSVLQVVAHKLSDVQSYLLSNPASSSAAARMQQSRSSQNYDEDVEPELAKERNVKLSCSGS